MNYQSSPSEILERLWKEGYFEKERQIDNIVSKCKEYRYNFDHIELHNFLVKSEFILVSIKQFSEKFSTPIYIQRGPCKNISNIDEIIYSKGSGYDFYRDMEQILSYAEKEVVISDGFVESELLNLYLRKLNKGITIRILTNPNNYYKKEFNILVKKFSEKNEFNIEARESTDCHDRFVFADSNVWIFGNSMKNAGKKPTYLIKIKDGEKMKSIFDLIWGESTKIAPL